MVEKPKMCGADCQYCEECPEIDCTLDDWELLKRRKQYQEKSKKHGKKDNVSVP